MTRPLRVLDLCSGLNGWGDPFREAGHEVFAIDIESRFDADAPSGCHNLRPDHALDCCCRDHVAAPRGSRTGTQGGVSTEEAGRIPRDLAERFRVALERDLGTTRTEHLVDVIGTTRIIPGAVASVSR